MKTKAKLSTKDHLLDVAERHFASFGFAGTSLRGIIKEAKVNVAAVAYHFGTKEELFSAVIARFAAPVVAEQLRLLELALAKNDVALPAILLAFYTPPVTLVKGKEAQGKSLALLLGRAQTEPEPIFSMVDQHYAHCRGRFIDAFRRVLPQASEADLQWHFEFMLSLIVCVLMREGPIKQRYGDTTESAAEDAVARMMRFCLSGMS